MRKRRMSSPRPTELCMKVKLLLRRRAKREGRARRHMGGGVGGSSEGRLRHTQSFASLYAQVVGATATNRNRAHPSRCAAAPARAGASPPHWPPLRSSRCRGGCQAGRAVGGLRAAAPRPAQPPAAPPPARRRQSPARPPHRRAAADSVPAVHLTRRPPQTPPRRRRRAVRAALRGPPAAAAGVEAAATAAAAAPPPPPLSMPAAAAAAAPAPLRGRGRAPPEAPAAQGGGGRPPGAPLGSPHRCCRSPRRLRAPKRSWAAWARPAPTAPPSGGRALAAAGAGASPWRRGGSGDLEMWAGRAGDGAWEEAQQGRDRACWTRAPGWKCRTFWACTMSVDVLEAGGDAGRLVLGGPACHISDPHFRALRTRC